MTLPSTFSIRVYSKFFINEGEIFLEYLLLYGVTKNHYLRPLRISSMTSSVSL